MDASIMILGVIATVAFIAAVAKPRTTDGLEDTPVSADNIRRGVANGWYNAVLVRVDGAPCVRLSGRTKDGKLFTDVFRISQADFDALQAEGYLIEL